nr:MAG TPA: hypothetical protein [Caudoviricetes sp.]
MAAHHAATKAIAPHATVEAEQEQDDNPNLCYLISFLSYNSHAFFSHKFSISFQLLIFQVR